MILPVSKSRLISCNLLYCIGSLLIGIFFTALMAGIYPSWIITKFQPAITLKSGSVNANPQSSLLRKGLVVTQFSISICLLIGFCLLGNK